MNNVLNYRQSDDFVEKHDRSHVKVEHEVLKKIIKNLPIVERFKAAYSTGLKP